MAAPHCRLCGSTKATRHHLIPQSLALRVGHPLVHERVPARHLVGITATRFVGFWKKDIIDPLNIVPLCRLHHDMVEAGILTTTLRNALRDAEVAHIRRVAGPRWLDAHYPPERKETVT